MTITKNDIVYCDANFLVAYGSKKAKQPEIQKRARILFATLLISGCKIIASNLTFDEAWLGIRRELGPKSIINNIRFMISKLIERVGLRLINYGATEFSYSEIFNGLSSFTNKLLNHKNFNVMQFQNAAIGVKSALNNMNKFGLRPRDSFHLAIMKDNKTTHFISNDGHFKNKNQIGISLINF
ncbi:PIN domain-containing protein [Patescibacteria group bacterium]|nr:PIN domain-containing protein [Patescibacteria group bacterium]MBU4056940.1 PIN domain-containing protein [Patescibacteria group bacterium]MBU4368803.1 PIN domain-containing protein [Patescibacteria group bacterium]